MITHQLNLTYSLSPGWMAAFVTGLREGKSIARRCDGCARVSFPPLRICECGVGAGIWIELAGTAKIIHRTDGQDGSFALVQFDGADTQSVVRLDHIGQGQDTGRIAANACGLPAMTLVPIQQSSDL